MKTLLALLFVAGSMAAQQRMEVTLERQEGSAWKAVEPGLVFESGDRVRFRFRANFDGYLYVMNAGTSGSYSLLFPRDETGRDNKIESGREYLIPATQAWFRIAGPPGQDVVYWLASPIPLDNGVSGFVPSPPKSGPPKTLLPRCDETLMRARGLCIDSSAGLRGVPEGEELPENLKGLERARSRELVIMRQQDSSLVSSPVPLAGPVLYEFRLAHR